LRKITKQESVKSDSSEKKKAFKKERNVIKNFKRESKGKAFTKSDNPFIQLESELHAMKIKVRQVKGNKDSIQLNSDSFAKGGVQCLLLNATHASRIKSLLLNSCQHLHAMSIEEEKQKPWTSL
jgi:hypothetical protein